MGPDPSATSRTAARGSGQALLRTLVETATILPLTCGSPVRALSLSPHPCTHGCTHLTGAARPVHLLLV